MYKAIFFDLDRTLWDMERNNFETLHDLYFFHHLEQKGISNVALFVNTYNHVNHAAWELYREDKIDTDSLRWRRFNDTFLVLGLNNIDLAKKMSDDYIRINPIKTHLIPHALDSIDYLFKKYALYIITNGFEEVQRVKINNCGINLYFKKLITSETVGYKKPDVRIFQYALKESGFEAADCLMVGDEYETDIAGAKNAGIDQIYFNPEAHFKGIEATYKISSLKTLQDML
ncbi:MAG: YjjG family noncanonical pyrimidine nucleotidase [Bacteroidales bacterium]|jgi:putative hydrolase of the HAD superfamily|nr:YjjG family noncanonical pyrimidine nucleotidase [Bacteroidales bacterium]